MALLNIDKNAKTVKGQLRDYLTGILYLAPSDQSGVINVCPFASEGCRAACLYSAGRGRMPNVIKGRVNRTLRFATDRQGFISDLETEIAKLVRKAKKLGMTPAVRLNGTSDISWENYGIMEKFPDVQFYDYTKIFKRMAPDSKASKTPNYHLTFSRSESNHAHAELVAAMGKNVAVVFDSKNLPNEYMGLPVISGDEDDLRFLDPKPAIVGLYAKGDGKKDHSGFVVKTA